MSSSVENEPNSMNNNVCDTDLAVENTMNKSKPLTSDDVLLVVDEMLPSPPSSSSSSSSSSYLAMNEKSEKEEEEDNDTNVRDLFSTPAVVAPAPNNEEMIHHEGDTDNDQEEKAIDANEPPQPEPPTSPEESEQDRIRRENAESERLAWEMMREESANAYRVQMEFIQQASGEMSEEDLEAIRMAMREGGFAVEEPEAEQQEGGDGEGEEEDEEDGQEDEEEEEEDGSDVDRWDYDRLLALGEQIGDVKTERWRLRAARVIARLPITNYADIQVHTLLSSVFT